MFQCSSFVKLFCTILIYFICLSRSTCLMELISDSCCFNFFPIKSAVLYYCFHSRQPSLQIMFCLRTPRCRTGWGTQWGKASKIQVSQFFIQELKNSIKMNVMYAQVAYLTLVFSRTLLVLVSSTY